MIALLAVLLGQLVPGAAWDERTPADAGLSRETLDALRDRAGGRGCVVRGGTLVYAWGDASKSADVASAEDPVISALLLMAVQEGRLSGLDARISEVEPRLSGKNAGITWRQLVRQESGYGREEGPGDAWWASGHARALAYDTLMEKVFVQPGSEALRRRLSGPLQFQDPCGFEASGEQGRSGRLSVSVRDFARFGLLILRGGAWGARRILAPSLTYLFVSAPLPADRPRSSGGSGPMIPDQRTRGEERTGHGIGAGFAGFGWWGNGIDDRRRQLFVDGPGDLVAALGEGGKRALWILPSLDLVVSWNDSGIDDLQESPGKRDAAINQAVRLMVQAILR